MYHNEGEVVTTGALSNENALKKQVGGRGYQMHIYFKLTEKGLHFRVKRKHSECVL